MYYPLASSVSSTRTARTSNHVLGRGARLRAAVGPVLFYGWNWLFRTERADKREREKRGGSKERHCPRNVAMIISHDVPEVVVAVASYLPAVVTNLLSTMFPPVDLRASLKVES